MFPTQLAFSIITDSYHKSIFNLGQLFQRSECTLHQLQIKAQGHGYNVSGVAEGCWKNVAMLDVLLCEQAETHHWDLKVWRPKDSSRHTGLPYTLEAVFLEDQSRTMGHLFELLSDLDIAVESCDYGVSTLDPEHFLARVRVQLQLPYNTPIQVLRERFYHLCDIFNIDGSLELCQG